MLAPVVESIWNALPLALLAATPLLLAVQGELVTQRAGILNLGLEGMMLVAAMTAVLAAQASGSAAIGFAGGIAGATCVAALFGAFVIGLRTDQIVTGTAINLAALGLTGFVYQGLRHQEIFVQSIPRLSFDWIVPLAWIVCPATLALLLWNTTLGLRLRACGENPEVVRGTGTSAVGTGTSAVGTGTSAVGTGTSAVGTGTSAMGTGTSAMGTGTATTGTGTATTGTGTSATGTGTSAVGPGTSAVGTGTSAMGTGASAAGTGSSVPRTTLSVAGHRAVALGIEAVLAGLAGGYLSLGLSSGFAENMTAGRGFIALSIVIFGRWSIKGAVLGTAVFGLAAALQYALQASNTGVSYHLLLAVPYTLTLLILCGFAGRVRSPQSLGR